MLLKVDLPAPVSPILCREVRAFKRARWENPNAALLGAGLVDVVLEHGADVAVELFTANCVCNRE